MNSNSLFSPHKNDKENIKKKNFVFTMNLSSNSIRTTVKKDSKEHCLINVNMFGINNCVTERNILPPTIDGKENNTNNL
jgi:hypothetical protein